MLQKILHYYGKKLFARIPVKNSHWDLSDEEKDGTKECPTT